MSTMLTLAAFWGLVAFTASRREGRLQLRSRSFDDWILDMGGLLVQGWLVPILALGPLVSLYSQVWPTWRGSLVVPAWTAFLLAFVVVDYAYYWNHRLLHTARLWPLHRVHHTAVCMDVFVTSRNTLWTSFLIIYLWSNSAMAFALADPAPYFLGASLTAILDLARHSPIDFAAWPRFERALASVLIMPKDHALHHADLPVHGNYGANLSLWDRLHRTYLRPQATPAPLGVRSTLSLFRSLWWPFQG